MVVPDLKCLTRGMMVTDSIKKLCAAVFITTCGVFQVNAELPGLDERLWVGRFLGVEDRTYHFGVSTRGVGLIQPLGKKGAPASQRLGVGMEFFVMETLPDGKLVVKALRPETLESKDPASSKFTTASFRAKVAGDASFEVTIENDRGEVSLSGKLLDPGQLKNPLQFGIRVIFPNGYPYASLKPVGQKAQDAFDEKTKDDRLQLKWANGKGVKLPLKETADASSKEVTGPGVVALSYEVSSHHGRKVELIASEDSFFTLSNTAGKPLNEGFSAIWLVDPVKDPAGRARLSFEVK